MNEQLSNAIATLVQSSLKAFETGASFMAAELPDVVHQLLVWHMVYSSVMCAGGVVLLFFAIKLDMKVYHMAKGTDDMDALVLGWGLLGTLMRLIAYGIPLSMLNLTWLKIWVAPKIFLIEYAASLVK